MKEETLTKKGRAKFKQDRALVPDYNKDDEIVNWCDQCSLTKVCIRYAPGYFCPK